MRHLCLPVFGLLALHLGGARAAEEFETCLAELRPQAQRAAVAPASFDLYTRALAPDMSVVALLDDQPEFKTPIWDYLAGLVDEERVADGRALLAQWKPTLDAVNARFGVDAATVVAVWGVESNFGRSFGKRPLVASLATLSCFGRRQSYFRGEFFSLLKLLQQGDVADAAQVGSWAGAFGHTQFMPSTYQRLAVDFDGDGRRDLVGSVPDALASTANFLLKGGWKSGLPWGWEVKLPAGFDSSVAGRKNKRPLADWLARGVKRVGGEPLPADGQAALLLPAGPPGPGLPRHRQLRRDLRLQRRRKLCAGDCPPVGPAARRRSVRHALAHRRPWPRAPGTARAADPAAGSRPRHRRGGRHARRGLARGDQARAAAAGPAGRRAGGVEAAEGAAGFLSASGSGATCCAGTARPPRTGRG